jgi:hypothetical protein
MRSVYKVMVSIAVAVWILAILGFMLLIFCVLYMLIGLLVAWIL